MLRPSGKLVIGFIDRDSGLGRSYLEHQSESLFYREAIFYSAGDVSQLLQAEGFVARAWGQTLFRPLSEATEVEPVRAGTGRGAFVVVMAERSERTGGREPAPSVPAPTVPLR